MAPLVGGIDLARGWQHLGPSDATRATSAVQPRDLVPNEGREATGQRPGTGAATTPPQLRPSVPSRAARSRTAPPHHRHRLHTSSHRRVRRRMFLARVSRPRNVTEGESRMVGRQDRDESGQRCGRHRPPPGDRMDRRPGVGARGPRRRRGARLPCVEARGIERQSRHVKGNVVVQRDQELIAIAESTAYQSIAETARGSV